jgi:CheY-like chemotaxis protein
MMSSRILVVDDYEGVVNLFSKVLAQHGYVVETASSGMEAVRKAREIMPDLVLMDVNLPDTDGLMAAFMLRSAPDTRRIPILAMSGQYGADLRDEALGLGCIEFLQKPFPLSTLLKEVERVLAERASNQVA